MTDLYRGVIADAIDRYEQLAAAKTTTPIAAALIRSLAEDLGGRLRDADLVRAGRTAGGGWTPGTLRAHLRDVHGIVAGAIGPVSPATELTMLLEHYGFAACCKSVKL